MSNSIFDSKNDYEYVLFEDMKASGFEPVDVRSGYLGERSGRTSSSATNGWCFSSGAAAREALGQLPAASRDSREVQCPPDPGFSQGMPELKANSDEIKLQIVDR